ncbi:hypothetical protein ACFQWG_12805 [Schaalia naturae]|uniref:Uncharacterized protein n=1 Tax=Schaalia naturae TaxID=635203 RepID=A0ABW2SQF0_9ACTO
MSAWTVAGLAAMMAMGLAGAGATSLAVGPLALGVRAVAAVAVTAVACAGLGVGWPDLTESPMTVAGRVVVAVAGIVAGAGVMVWRDMFAVTLAAGLGVVCLVGAELAFAPAPRDLSGAEPRRAAPGSGGRPAPMTVSLPGAVTGALVSTAGACWVALAAAPQWSGTAVIACFVVVAAVAGDQIGRTYRANSLGALCGGILGGLLVGAAAWAAARGGIALPRVLPHLARGIGDTAAILVAGLATGVSVALAVIAVDGLLGDHGRRHPTARGGLARGCAKFLVAVLPFYVMIRVGGI